MSILNNIGKGENISKYRRIKVYIIKRGTQIVIDQFKKITRFLIISRSTLTKVWRRWRSCTTDPYQIQEKIVHHWLGKEHSTFVDEDECKSFSYSSSKTKQLQFKYKNNAEIITKHWSCKTNAKRNTERQWRRNLN